MKIHHLRNATLIMECGNRFILVDPMLGPKSSALPFTLFRFKPKRNPLLDLPMNANELLEKVTHCLITHLHTDHLDKEAISFLKRKKIPIVCSQLDHRVLKRNQLTIDLSLAYWKPTPYLGGKLIGIPAVHGYGFVRKIAGDVMGFYLKLPNESSIYISSDTVYTPDVHKVLSELQPGITVFAAGMAQLDIGKLLLMDAEDIIRFIENSPGNVIANHMEALNHCPNTREHLKNLLKDYGLSHKVAIPEDGEVISF